MPLISLDIRMLRSFVSVVQTGSITVTARQLGRTQPAITLQLQRLEELINTPLLRHEGRRQLLTDDGDLVLSYAKSILRLHDEMLQRLASPDVEGTVVLGTPDLYAAFVLPAILSRFRKAFPKVQANSAANCRRRWLDLSAAERSIWRWSPRWKVSPAAKSWARSS